MKVKRIEAVMLAFVLCILQAIVSIPMEVWAADGQISLSSVDEVSDENDDSNESNPPTDPGPEDPEPSPEPGDDDPVEDSGQCGTNLTWTLQNKLLTIKGSGTMDNWNPEENNDAPWSEYGNSISSVKISDGVTSIGDYAFSECSSLVEVDISDSVTNIGESAFSGCGNLENVEIPDNVTKIGDCAFSECRNLVKVELSDSLTTIGEYAFSECSKLVKVEIPDGVTKIGDCAFSECSELVEVEIPESVKEGGIGNNVFTGYGSNFRIVGAEGSDAKKYAEKNNIPFHSHSSPEEYITDAKNHWHKCNTCSDVFDLEEHTEGTAIITKAATEGAEGIRTFPCEDCGYEMRKETIAKLSHDDKNFDMTKWQSDAKTHWRGCFCSRKKNTANHNFTAWTTGRAATKTKEGIRYRLCKICGYVQSGKLNKLVEVKINIKLSSLSSSGKGITAEWSKVKNATGYYVYRKTTDGEWEKIATVRDPAKTYYIDRTATKNGRKYSYKVQAYSTNGKMKQKSKDSTAMTVMYLDTPKISSVKNDKGNTATVKYAKNTKASGYEICYSTSSKFTSDKVETAKPAKNISKSISELKKGKKYYIRVRAYTKSGEKTYYSAWSGTKSVSITK